MKGGLEVVMSANTATHLIDLMRIPFYTMRQYWIQAGEDRP